MIGYSQVLASRRSFLKVTSTAVGVFILGAYLPFSKRALAEPEPAQGLFDPNLFLKIGADNSVTIISKHFEMGQGVTTGLATLIAEELEADWSMIRFEFAPNDAKLYNNLLFGPVMGTGRDDLDGRVMGANALSRRRRPHDAGRGGRSEVERARRRNQSREGYRQPCRFQSSGRTGRSCR